MIDAEFIDKILAISKTEIREINDINFSDKKLYPIYEPMPDVLEINTLTGVVDYIKINPDKLNLKDIFIHIDSYNVVGILSGILEKTQNRNFHLCAKFQKNNLALNDYMDIENMIIMLRTQFENNDKLNNLISLIGNVDDVNNENINDDGITQNVTVKKGISLKDKKDTPVIVKLKPYRTFTEIEQPESYFLFRINKKYENIQCALFEAKGNNWEFDIIKNIKAYLKKQLPNINIIS